MAPECFETGARPTPASDLYALGVTLFMLMTGHLPGPPASVFPRSLSPALTLSDPTQELTTEVASLASLIALLLEPDPSTRPCHADWVARALEQVRARLGATRTTLRDPIPSPVSPAAAALRAFEHRLPLPLSPMVPAIREASRDEDTIATSIALGELGLGVVRYA